MYFPFGVHYSFGELFRVSNVFFYHAVSVPRSRLQSDPRKGAELGYETSHTFAFHRLKQSPHSAGKRSHNSFVLFVD